MKIISWNIAHQSEPWRLLASSGADVALLQEAARPPCDLSIETDGAEWQTGSKGANQSWRTVVARLSDRVRVRWKETIPPGDATGNGLRVSLGGSLAVAEVEELATGETVTLVSMYGVWEKSGADTGSGWIYADASVHRLISDLCGLIGRQRGHRIIAAGDLNILHGYGEEGSEYWRRRYATIFERFDTIGLGFVGPQAPHGKQAEPRPGELPEDSKDVPTFRTRRSDPSSATRQLDFVFASNGLRDRLKVSALNSAEEWGPSDHCQVIIELGQASPQAYGPA